MSMKSSSAVTGLFVLFALGAAQASDFPNAPIRLVVPYPPGGPVDFVARVVSVPLGQELGQPIVIENKAGAGGNIAANEMSRAKADGYALSLVYETHATTNLFYKNFKWDAFKSFDYISLLGYSPLVLTTSTQSGLDTLPKLITALKARPGALNQAITGPGAASVLKPELLHQAMGTKVTYVPFPGVAPALQALVGGQIDMALVSVTAALPLIQSKKVNAVAVGAAKSLAALPGVPTMNSTVPGFESTAWVGIVAPKGLSSEVFGRLQTAVHKVMMSDAVRKQLEASTFVVLATDQKGFTDRARADYRDAEHLVQKGILKPDE
ncbi:Bug family tripartite tricarboxylate transporter substrate binding protein [Variovorax sp. LjRoot84]|uniref:Bug family tripartite tricarboxylate transporter substrate binding protein n=1 Tax=Variovorax sp. LjRoot84 TaxID=3342340 RepID=UPI003F517A4D